MKSLILKWKVKFWLIILFVVTFIIYILEIFIDNILEKIL